MATEKQIEANRINAQSCHGPTSEAGLARSSQNALKTGIYAKAEVTRIENRDEYEALATAFHERFAPATPEEVSLIDALIRHEWLSRRYMRADTALWEKSFENSKDILPGEVFQYFSGEFTRAGRLYNAARRGFNTTLKELRQLQAQMKAQPAAPALAVAAPAPPAAALPPQPAITEPRLEGAAPESTPSKPLTPELVSFRQNRSETQPPNSETTIKEHDPPIAA